MAFFAANVLDKRTHFPTIADKSTDAGLRRGNEMKCANYFPCGAAFEYNSSLYPYLRLVSEKYTIS